MTWWVNGHLQHPQVDGGVFVPGEADVADLSRLAGLDCGLDRTTGSEDAVRIFHANDFVELHQVDHVGLQAAKRLL